MSIKPTPQTVRKHRREAEPDLVDRIFQSLVAERPELSPLLVEIKAAIRRDYGGERGYVKKRDDVEKAIISMFNGRNVAEIARTLGIGRTTVYRVLRQGFR